MISHVISRYHDVLPGISYHAISQDTIYRDVVSISRSLGTDIEISYPVEIFFDTEHYCFAQLGAPSLVHQESEMNGCLAVELQKQGYLFEKIYVRPSGGT